MRDHDPVTPLTRGALARLTGCNLETVRYYETVGLIPPPPRSAGGHRLYDRAHLVRLRFILRARALGFGLDAVRGLLGLGDGSVPDCAAVRDRAQAHLAQVRDKIADLRRIEAVLADTVTRCTGEIAAPCPVLDALGGDWPR